MGGGREVVMTHGDFNVAVLPEGKRPFSLKISYLATVTLGSGHQSTGSRTLRSDVSVFRFYQVLFD